MNTWAGDGEKGTTDENVGSLNSCMFPEEERLADEDHEKERDMALHTVSDNGQGEQTQEGQSESENANTDKMISSGSETIANQIVSENTEGAEETVPEGNIPQDIVDGQIEENEEIAIEEESISISEDSVEGSVSISGDSVSDNGKKPDGDENDLKQEKEERPQKDDAAILKVSMPAKVKGYLDPINLSGKGGVYSDEYKVVNYGNRDIAIKIKKINISYHNGTSKMSGPSEETVNDELMGDKKIDINMVWKNADESQEMILDMTESEPDVDVIYLKASEYDDEGRFVRLRKGSEGIFYFTGSLDSDPDAEWHAGDVAVSFSYAVEPLEQNVNK